jgi:beta-lactamase regulating signal transducer with metallopeptidase domain
MTDTLLTALQRQALLLSLGALLLLALRPLLLKRLGARAAYAAWLLLPALLVTPLLPSLGAKPLPAVITVAELARTAAVPLLPAPHAEALWPRVLLAFWLGGAALVLGIQALRQWRLARHGTRLPAGASPALVGLWRPRVALPADFEQRFGADERQLILAHEDVHRARHDNAWNLLACVLTALHWWNPLAWAAARRMQADQELACDAVVLGRQPGALATYTRALLAAHDLRPHGAPLASRWGSSHPLVERIAMLNRPAPFQRRRAAVLGLALLSVVGLTYAAQSELPTSDEALVDIRMTMTLSNGESSEPRIIAKLGQPTTIEWGWDVPGRTGGWGMVLTVTRDPDGRLRTLTRYSEGQPFKPLEGSHTAITQSGEAIELLRTSTTGGPDLKVRRVVTLLPASAKPPTVSTTETTERRPQADGFAMNTKRVETLQPADAPSPNQPGTR